MHVHAVTSAWGYRLYLACIVSEQSVHVQVAIEARLLGCYAHTHRLDRASTTGSEVKLQATCSAMTDETAEVLCDTALWVSTV